MVLCNAAVGGVGISAVCALVGTLAGVDVTEVACLMTAGVDGWIGVSFSSVAGVIRSSWVLSLMMTVVSRQAMRSITASFTMEYGKGLRVISRRLAYH